ncbi:MULTISPECIES: hypothetical protein [unclassified Mycobacterium]|uniref:hypothetical protein n=1 Tax=unclassified Mycobacterium TaxID=2642494 RepID=UPI0006DCE51B|nr:MULTISPECIES: hypothetical protein [unclassified Mycobacterium]
MEKVVLRSRETHYDTGDLSWPGRWESVIDAWILDAVRTPRGRGRPDGGLHAVHPQALFARCLTMCTGGGMGTATIIERV